MGVRLLLGLTLLLSFTCFAEFEGDKVYPNGTNQLYLAAQKGDVKLVKELLNKGAKVENPRLTYSPLVAASMMGHYEIVELLLKKGAKNNPKVSKSSTLLEEIKNSGDLKMINLFKKYGAKFK